MKLRPEETVLVGAWVEKGGTVRSDAVAERIKYLIDSELEFVADGEEYGAWETLYRDPQDNRLWERTYPQSGMHGGGPPLLRYLSESEARSKYKFGT